jgi:hypothetical protein
LLLSQLAGGQGFGQALVQVCSVHAGFLPLFLSFFTSFAKTIDPLSSTSAEANKNAFFIYFV